MGPVTGPSKYGKCLLFLLQSARFFISGATILSSKRTSFLGDN